MAQPLPDWLHQLRDEVGQIRPEHLSRLVPPDDDDLRESAVLVLFGEGPEGPDLLLIERAHDLRSHAGQPAFPGGTVDEGDAGVEAAALREAAEETGLDPAGVDVFAQLPPLWLQVSNFSVVPVLGWWRAPSPVRVVDAGEVASVHRVPIAELADPANRLLVRHPRGHVGPAFRVRGLLVWGFTAGLLDRILAAAGWERPWDRSRVEEYRPGGSVGVVR
jgi:8-oxo-dGTP pyrophosphatase MutT (NUDIX family)